MKHQIFLLLRSKHLNAVDIPAFGNNCIQIVKDVPLPPSLLFIPIHQNVYLKLTIGPLKQQNI